MYWKRLKFRVKNDETFYDRVFSNIFSLVKSGTTHYEVKAIAKIQNNFFAEM